ncbi:MAG: hypothetical protein IKE22_10585, partial [Atopobiaceae bacterium]|nr:hypothetical protein [Atopobiaceae bacterium]
MSFPQHTPVSPAVRGTGPTDVSSRSWNLALKAIEIARGLIVSQNPFLSSAIGLLELAPAQLDTPFACDGKALFVDAPRLLEDISRTRETPAHDFLHVLLHCILLHPFVSASVDGAAWDLASDVAAELIVADIMGPRAGKRGEQIAAMRKHLSNDLGGSITTERLYRSVVDGAYESERRQWASLVYVDDHCLWPSADGTDASGGETGDASGPQNQSSDAATKATPTSADTQAASGDGSTSSQQKHLHEPVGSDGQGEFSDDGGHDFSADDADAEKASDESSHHTEDKASTHQRRGASTMTEAQRDQAEKAWGRVAKSMRVNLETISRTRGEGLGGLVKELEVGVHQRVDYRSFLRQFAVEHEDMRLSDDEFDYVFYTYGLELYGDMPLVEPLEYRQEKRIRDFAIVIDTSSSVSDKVVQEFVNTTFDVLSSEGGFFTQTNIHIIQADARVQSDAKITSLADLDRWRRNIKLLGFGGTDFRPAFAYVQQLRQQGEFDDLQGLLYFTDGWGIYPNRMPPYKCAFVFYD